MDISVGLSRTAYSHLNINAPADGNNRRNSQPSGAAKPDEYNDPKVRADKRAGRIECQTCKNRKYQDQSNDPGVSFKAASHISPESSASAVMSHEQEHVSHESAKASREGRRVVSQTVRLETSVCPECGRTYVSGGETTTVTASDGKKDYFMDKAAKAVGGYFGGKIDVRV